MIFLVILILIKVISQALLKKESLKNNNAKSSHYLLKMLTSYRVILAYILSFLNLFIWVIALSEVTLVYAVIFSSISYILILFVDKFLFNIQINWNKIIGSILIIISVILFVYD